MVVGSMVADHLTDFFTIHGALMDHISVVGMAIAGCCALHDLCAELVCRRKRENDDEDRLASYDELQKYTNVKLFVIERDFLVPKVALRRLMRIRAFLVGVVVCISLVAVRHISSWWWVAAASGLYLAVAVGTVWFRESRRRKADDRRGAARVSGSGG